MCLLWSTHVLSCKFALGNVISCYNSVGLEVVFIVIFLVFLWLCLEDYRQLYIAGQNG
jgi:hypothetical protein